MLVPIGLGHMEQTGPGLMEGMALFAVRGAFQLRMSNPSPDADGKWTAEFQVGPDRAAIERQPDKSWKIVMIVDGYRMLVECWRDGDGWTVAFHDCH